MAYCMQVLLTQILPTILMFGIIILVHELGHFIAAKSNKIIVQEFSLGMGPAIFKFTKGDTQYTIRLFPIGGYVSMPGESNVFEKTYDTGNDTDGETENGINNGIDNTKNETQILSQNANKNLAVKVENEYDKIDSISSVPYDKLKEMSTSTEKDTEINEEDKDNGTTSFDKKPIWRRSIVLIAGAAMNLLLGFIIMAVAIIIQPQDIETATVESVKTNSASYNEVLLQPGDKILEMNGFSIWHSNDISFPIYKMNNELKEIRKLHQEKQLPINYNDTEENQQQQVNELMREKITPDIVILRGGEKITLENASIFNEDGKLNFEFQYKPKNIATVATESVVKSIAVGRMIYVSLFDLFTGQVDFVEDVKGPIGTSTIVSKATQTGWNSYLTLIALISINVGIFNLLPFPALDGGQLIFLIIEKIRRKPVHPKVGMFINGIGFALLILLTIVITFKDIIQMIWK